MKVESATTKPIRVLIADDHPLVMEGVAGALQRFGIDVVGCTSNAQDVVQRYGKARPDVVVMDVRFGPAMNGLEAVKALLQARPQAKVVIYTQFDQIELVQEAYKAGCLAFVTKISDPEDLVSAIRKAAQGETFLLPEIGERLALLSIRPGHKLPPVHAQLSERDTDVFKLLAKGHTIAETAKTMALSPRTISNICLHIKQVLGVQNIPEMTRLAVKLGVID